MLSRFQTSLHIIVGTVILGSLELKFPDFGDPAFDTYSYSDINNLALSLREITGALVVVYLTHLERLGSLFPNLAGFLIRYLTKTTKLTVMCPSSRPWWNVAVQLCYNDLRH